MPRVVWSGFNVLSTMILYREDGEIGGCAREGDMRKLLIALGYRPPAPEAVVPMDLKPVMH